MQRHPSGFSGAAYLNFPTKRQQSPDAYTLHALLCKKFTRNFYKLTGIDDTWQADLCDMQNLVSDYDNVSKQSHGRKRKVQQYQYEIIAY
ncbi:hypothetical protein B566_EDAN014451 [Ephemera danica]|nr:hypothetical protein B566_EDAN014451 [Ephemera danica]